MYRHKSNGHYIAGHLSVPTCRYSQVEDYQSGHEWATPYQTSANQPCSDIPIHSHDPL